MGPVQAGPVNFEGRQVHPICVSSDGSRLFAVNTAASRLSVFALADPSRPALLVEVPVGLEPISVRARSNEEAWVVNEISDSVSVVSVSRRLVAATLQVKDEPADVVFAGGLAFVSVSGDREIRVFNATNHALVAAIPVQGVAPRAMAVSPDASKVYVAMAISGNGTTIVPTSDAPPQPAPARPDLPPPPPAGLIVRAEDTNWSHVIRYRVMDHDVAEIDAGELGVTRYFSKVGTIILGIAVRPTDGDLFVANTEARNLVHFETQLRGHAVDSRVTRIRINDGSSVSWDLNGWMDYAVFRTRPAARWRWRSRRQSLSIRPAPLTTWRPLAAIAWRESVWTE
jgi:DNA-binding beta-propeller fold protein YncE